MITIQEIRDKYPQYTDLSDQELADKLHTKYYSDLPKEDFYNRINLNQPLNKTTNQPKSNRELATNLFNKGNTALFETLGELGPGLGEAAVGITQSLASGIAPKFAQDIGNQVKISKERESLTPAQQTGRQIGRLLPALATGNGMGLFRGAVTSGAVSGLTKPLEEGDISNRALETGKEVAESVAGAGIIKGGIETGKAIIGKGKELFGPIRERAIAKFRKLIKEEGKDVGSIIDQAKSEGLDVIDFLDPRFKARAEARASLSNSREAIKIADESLQKLESNSKKLQSTVLDLVSKKKINSEKGGQILGENASKLIEDAKESRRISSKVLYDEGLKGEANLEAVALDNLSSSEIEKLGLKPGTSSLTLKELLQSPKIEKAINTARAKSKEYSKSPGALIYGNLHSKTKPVYTTETKINDILNIPTVERQFFPPNKMLGTNSNIRQIPLGSSANTYEKEYLTKPILKTAAQFKTKPNELKVLGAVRNIIKDQIGDPKLMGATTEQAALNLVKKGLENVINKANPTLMKAHQEWKKGSEIIEELVNSSIGKLARQFENKETDKLTQAALDVLKLPPNRIAQIRTKDPEAFNDTVRTSIAHHLSTDIIKKEGGFNKAIFGENEGEAIKAALQNPIAIKGLKKLSNILDSQAIRTELTKGTKLAATEFSEIPVPRRTITGNVLREMANIANKIIRNPKVDEEFTKFMFTKAGIKELEKIAQEKSPDISKKLVRDFLIKATSNIITNEANQ